MAIGPSLLKAHLKAEALKFEEQIDSDLRNSKMYGNTVRISAPKGMTHAHLDQIKKGYIDQGWTSVRWEEYNQHAGDMIIFDCTKKEYYQEER